MITHPEHQKARCATAHTHVYACIYIHCEFSYKKNVFIILGRTTYLTDNYWAVNTESLVLIIVFCEQLK